jgi:hypothetical protein
MTSTRDFILTVYILSRVDEDLGSDNNDELHECVDCRRDGR